MKNRLFYITAILMLASSAGCKKYGFNDSDGYEDYVDTLAHGTPDSSYATADYSFISQATIFPGIVALSQPRIDTTINIDERFKIVSADLLKVAVVPKPLNSVGLYEAPGEPVKVVVPDGVYGLTAQIGAWTDDLSQKAYPGRYPSITATFQLYPGVNYIRNPFGGNIFISPNKSEDRIIPVKVSGAVKSPDFVLGTSTDQDWVAEMQTTKVPFFILKGKHVAFVLPTSSYKLSPFSNPQELIAYWDWIYEHTYFKYIGLEDNPTDPRDQAPQLPMYYVFDKDITTGYWHSGFPIMVMSDLNNFSTVTNLNYIKTTGSWGALHENGHNYQCFSIFDVKSVMGETSNNLYSLFLAHETGISYKQLLEGRDHVDMALDFIKSSTDTSITQLTDPFAKIVFYDQLFTKMTNGWDFWPYLYKKARRQSRNSFSDIERWNFLYQTASEFNNTDMASFFTAWKIPISTTAKLQMAALYAPLSKDIWNYNPMTDQGGDNYIFPQVDDNTSWDILDFDSEQKSGEPAPSGPVAAVHDGNVATYWHSQWSTPVATYPHHITFDFSIKQHLSGLYFVQRPGSTAVNGRVKTINIYTSDDATNWTLAKGNVTLENNTNKQNIDFGFPAYARYYKVEFTSSYNGANFAAMSEIGGY